MNQTYFASTAYVGFGGVIEHNVGYPESIINYSKGNLGFVNIEFEFRVFFDIVNALYPSEIKTFNGALPADETAYKSWIASLTNNGQSYPNLSGNATFDTNYFMYLNKFNVLKDDSYPGGVHSSLPAKALKALFNGSFGKNNCAN